MLGGVGLARAITVTTDVTFLQAMGGLGVALSLLAGGYELAESTPG